MDEFRHRDLRSDPHYQHRFQQALARLTAARADLTVDLRHKAPIVFGPHPELTADEYARMMADNT